MGLIEYIEKLITEHGSAAISDKHLAFVREQAQALEKKVADLERENAGLKKRITELQAQVTAKSVLDDFVECRGALFKRKPTGGYHNAVYCPDCRGPMISFMGDLPFNCHKCSRSVSFSEHDLPAVMRDLAQQ